jgi:hypothetical protein
MLLVVQEAANLDCPIGFTPGQDGVSYEWPWPPDLDRLEGIQPAWRADHLRPVGDWRERVAPGTSTFWHMGTRRTAAASGGAAAMRLKARCWAGDDESWELPLPVAVSDPAAAALAKLILESP